MNPTQGRIIQFVCPDGETVRPAIIVRVWTDEVVNLSVFYDGTNDGYDVRGREELSGLDSLSEWATSVHYDGSEKPAARTWHWPKRT